MESQRSLNWINFLHKNFSAQKNNLSQNGTNWYSSPVPQSTHLHFLFYISALKITFTEITQVPFPLGSQELVLRKAHTS